MRFIILHNHFRPGGVRRVIELAAPHLARALRLSDGEIILVSGEAPEALWLANFQNRLDKVPVSCRIEPALLYMAEQRMSAAVLRRRLEVFFVQLLDAAEGQDCVVWAHNQGLGRNLPLTLTLQQACARRQTPLVLHHHDWWFDNRWSRWPEMRRSGFRSLPQVADTIFGQSGNVRHAAINQADAGVLLAELPGRAAWLPNLLDGSPRPSAHQVEKARQWLARELGDDEPVWLMPCRLLRRKNIAEALLLTRWLRPEAWLVTTGDITSAEEDDYARRLAAAARRHDWRLRLRLLKGGESGKPAMPELLAACEVVLLTSLLEGFGLPYLEAAMAAKPLLARALPNIAPDLAQLGFDFPQYYEDLLVSPDLFDWPAERRRQRELFGAWRRQLPVACRKLAGVPPLLAQSGPGPVACSRLSLTAQLEVLAQPPEFSWSRCAPLNPFLAVWRERAERGRLRAAAVPRAALRQLGGPLYARRFRELLAGQPWASPDSLAGRRVQEQLMRRKLEAANLYPLLMSPRT